MKKPDSFEHALQQQLDQSIDTLDDATLNKLKAARLKALAAAAVPDNLAQTKEGQTGTVVSLNAFRQLPKPALAIAASLLLAVPLWYFTAASIDQPSLFDSVYVASTDVLNNELGAENSQLNALDLITSFAELDDDELDMVNDLDFALWLVEQENTHPVISG
ncbi:MAG: hypothetical protein ACI910_002768 [Oleispira sp.]|jgi:hypothetical protein